MTKFKSLICPIICYNLTINIPIVKPKSKSESTVPQKPRPRSKRQFWTATKNVKTLDIRMV